jgi:hypothetical protein
MYAPIFLVPHISDVFYERSDRGRSLLCANASTTFFYIPPPPPPAAPVLTPLTTSDLERSIPGEKDKVPLERKLDEVSDSIVSVSVSEGGEGGQGEGEAEGWTQKQGVEQSLPNNEMVFIPAMRLVCIRSSGGCKEGGEEKLNISLTISERCVP